MIFALLHIWASIALFYYGRWIIGGIMLLMAIVGP